MLTCMTCEKNAPEEKKSGDKCVQGGCPGFYADTGEIIALAFKHKKPVQVRGQTYHNWDVLCRACMGHELWGKSVYYDCPEVQVVTAEEGHIEHWGEERVISCSVCGNVLLDDSSTETSIWDDPD